MTLSKQAPPQLNNKLLTINDPKNLLPIHKTTLPAIIFIVKRAPKVKIRLRTLTISNKPITTPINQSKLLGIKWLNVHGHLVEKLNTNNENQIIMVIEKLCEKWALKQNPYGNLLKPLKKQK